MVGVDLTRITRFENKGVAFINRILHPDEIKLFTLVTNKSKFLATRWAIKEAIFKADNNLKNFREINIVKSDQKYTFANFQISTSNEGDWIIAFVQKERHEPTKT